MSPFCDEQEALEAAIKGDQEGFQFLYYRYHRLVYKYCLHFSCMTEEDARDIIQETFKEAFRNLSDLREKAKFLPWLMKIAKSCVLRCLRKNRWTKDRDFIARYKDYFESERVYNAEVEIREKRDELIREFLAEKGDKVVELYYIENLKTSEIAKVLDIPKSTVTTRLDRFRRKERVHLIKKVLDLLEK